MWASGWPAADALTAQRQVDHGVAPPAQVDGGMAERLVERCTGVAVAGDAPHGGA